MPHGPTDQRDLPRDGDTPRASVRSDVAFAETEEASSLATPDHAAPKTEQLPASDAADANDDGQTLPRTRSLAPPLLAPGSSFARYRIEERIGQGGMGEAYRAWDPSLHREVAIKVMLEPVGAPPPSSGATPSPRAARFEREARTAAAISHPNVVAIYEVGAVGSMAFIAMEYLRGRTLRDALATGSLPANEALRILCDVAKALEAAHEGGIVHRDVKPENIMLTRGGLVKVLDFGIAKPFTATAMRTESDVVTAAHVIVGSLRYMAPEQLHGEALDGRADQFAWGVVACELFSGAPPWPYTGQRLVRAVMTESVPGEVLARVPVEVRTVVMRALEKEATSRFPSFTELLAEIDAARVGTHSQPAISRGALAETVDRHAETRTSPEHSVTVSTVTDERPSLRTTRKAPRIAKRVVAAVLGASIAAAGIALGVAALRTQAVAVVPMLSGPHTIAVLAPANGSADAADEWLSIALSELLTSALRGSGMQTVSGENIANLTRDLRIVDSGSLSTEMLQRVGAHAGADLVATGSYSVKAGELRVAMVAHDVARNVTVASAEVHGPASDPLAVAQKASAQLRQAMGLAPLTAVEQTDVRASVPANVDAARAYVAGVERRRAFELEGARVKLEEAAKLDGSHALTHAALAQVASDLGDGARAEAEGKLAVELSKGLSRERRLLSEGVYAMQVSDAATAMDRYMALSTMAPMNTDYRLLLVAAQVKGQRFADARKTLDAIRADNPGSHSNPRIDRWEASVAMWQSDDATSLKAARAAAETAQRQGAMSVLADARMFEAVALWDMGDNAASFEALDVSASLYRSIGDRLHENYVDVMRANFAAGVGQLATARKSYERALENAVAIGASEQIRDFIENLAIHSFAMGDTRAAKKLLERAAKDVGQGATSPPMSCAFLRLSAAIARVEGDIEGARLWAERAVKLADVLQNGSDSVLAFEEYSQVLLAHRDYAGALAAARRAKEIATGSVEELRTLAAIAEARALLALGKPMEAETAILAAEGSRHQPLPHLQMARVLRARANARMSRLDIARSLLNEAPRPADSEDTYVRAAAADVDGNLQTPIRSH